MVLYYALGGGLGHLTRARRALDALGLRGDAVVLTASPYARDPRVTGGVPVIEVPRRLGHDRSAFRRWLGATIHDLAPDELIVDAFPAGILGELSGLALPPARLIARRLRWPAYRRRLAGPPPQYAVTHVVEPLSGAYGEVIRSLSDHVVPLPLAPPRPDADAPLHDGPHVAVVHSGPPEELSELVELAHELRPDPHARVVVVSPRRPPRLHGSTVWSDIYPVAPHLGHAEVIVTAAGWGAMHDTEHVRDRHRFVPFPRALDDQFARARLARLAHRMRLPAALATAAATL